MKFETIHGAVCNEEETALMAESGHIIEFGCNTGSVFVYKNLASWELGMPMPMKKLCKSIGEAIKLIEEDLCA